MIYKEITLGQALEMVNKKEAKDLFYQVDNGIKSVEGKSFYLQNIDIYTFFRRIPKEPEIEGLDDEKI